MISCIIILNTIHYSTAVCMDLPDISNGFIDYDIEEMPRPIGTVALYECDPGFVLMGQENRTCVEESGVGVFDGVEPVCDRKLFDTMRIRIKSLEALTL